MTRDRILGLIGVVWGGVILLARILGDSQPSGGAYGAGQATAIVFASLLVIVGAYYLLKRPARRL